MKANGCMSVVGPELVIVQNVGRIDPMELARADSENLPV